MKHASRPCWLPARPTGAGFRSTSGRRSTSSRWSVWDQEHHFEIRWLGLLANLLLVSALSYVVGRQIEKKIRSGQFHKFSLLSIVILTTLFSVGLGLTVEAFRSYHVERSYIQRLRQLEQESLVWLEGQESSRFPRLVEQLFNGGQTPWGNYDIFRAMADSSININITSIDDQEMNRILEVLSLGNFDIEVEAWEYNEQVQRNLKALDQYKIVYLNLIFDADEMLEKRVGDDYHKLTRDEALKQARFEFDLELELQNLERLDIQLTDCFAESDQLGAFLDLPATANILVEDIGVEGANFILETQDQWPKTSEFCVNDIPADLERRLDQRFPAPEVKNDSWDGRPPTGPF